MDKNDFSVNLDGDNQLVVRMEKKTQNKDKKDAKYRVTCKTLC
jgi:HSP20 family molecular chaperone IbpA